ncbi:MAG TPA: dihydrodipicolinate synthase family protein [Bryobacteraceae bacterium]|jgi:dihydrodipicolinate synthase/N-acetylneuraminate lyase|nr:dihydrodipicolinate synthase family protein [Bryobacteraceae bacterium]
MNQPLRGLITPLATPLALSDRPEPVLDVPALERLIDHVVHGGVHGIFLLGSTGEFASLGREMRQEIIRRTCAHTNRRVPVLVNIADTAIAETLRLADIATEAGADAVVLAAPYYFQHSQDDLLRYLEQITKRLSLPLFLYNIPHLTKTSFDPETVRRAADMPGIVGLKDSTGDLTYLENTLALLHDRPQFSVLIGPEDMLLDSMKRGAIGGVCGGSNLNPKLFVALYNAIVRGDIPQAEALQNSVKRMNRALYHTGFAGSSYLRGLKAALALAGLCRPDPSPPYFPFSDAEYALLEEGYRTCAPHS